MKHDDPRHSQDTSKDGRQDRPQDVLDRITVAQAADRLGVTQDAVRKRVARGTIRHDKDAEGRIFVYLDTFERESKTDQDEGQDKYTRSLEDQIEFLRQELERKDAIIMSLTHRIPELEATTEQREGHVTASEEPYNTHAPPVPETPVPDAQHKRSWWRAFFGLE